jgi:hypothetical protein
VEIIRIDLKKGVTFYPNLKNREERSPKSSPLKKRV